MAERLPTNLEFRPMRPDDVRDVLKIVRAHSADDAAEAKDSYAERGVEGQYVLLDGGRIVACTGARPIPDADDAYLLSWTYIDPDGANPQITARALLEQLMIKLRAQNGRKVFANVSAVDAAIGGGSAGGGAFSYMSFGFAKEVTHRDYYEPGESLTVMGYRLRPPEPHDEPDEPRQAIITDSDEIDETDDAYYIDWVYIDGDGDGPDEIARWIETIREWEGRVAFVGVPSNAAGVVQQFTAAGFREEGRLKDLIADGLDEVRLRKDIY